MKIIFNQESDTSWSAISTNVETKGWFYTELYHADIDNIDGKYMVRFQDRYFEKHPFLTLEDAQTYITLTYTKHNPQENGPKHQL